MWASEGLDDYKESRETESLGEAEVSHDKRVSAGIDFNVD
jgi:hypothetical protein